MTASGEQRIAENIYKLCERVKALDEHVLKAVQQLELIARSLDEIRRAQGRDGVVRQ